MTLLYRKMEDCKQKNRDQLIQISINLCKNDSFVFFVISIVPISFNACLNLV